MYSSPEQTRKNSKLDGRSGERTRYHSYKWRSLRSSIVTHMKDCALLFVVVFVFRLRHQPPTPRPQNKKDIWSCGTILYQMFSLLVDVPFDPVEILVNHTRVPPLSLHSVTTLSKEMVDIIMKSLEVDPLKRFESAESMDAALHQEEARILQGKKKPTMHFFETKDQSNHTPTNNIINNHHSNQNTPPTTNTITPPPPSLPAPSSSPSISVHPRHRPGRSKRPFASGETGDLPSKL